MAEGKILLVEDETIIALDEAESLKAYGFQVAIASSGETAVSLMKTSTDIDLVLMDLDLGSGIDGTETARRILEDRDVPIIFLSNHTEPEIVEKTEKITSYGYAVKNSGIAALIASIKMAFRLFEANRKVKMQEESLRESQEIFDLFLEHSPIYVFFKDERIRSIRLSRNYEAMLGRPIGELLGKTMDDLFPSDLAKSMIQDDLGILREGKPIKVVEELAGRTYETIKFPIRHADKASYLAGFTIDVTEAKATQLRLAKALEEKTVLLKELQHRVKNSMTTIQSLIHLERDRTSSGETAAVLENLMGRVSTMTKLYSLLAQEEDVRRIRLDSYLSSIIRSLAASQSGRKERIRVREELEAVEIDAKRATPVGLILNELLTNIYKHAFPGESGGELVIRLLKDRGEIVLEASDDGIRLPDDFSPEKSSGLGLRLILILKDQLRGSFRHIPGERTAFRLSFPAET